MYTLMAEQNKQTENTDQEFKDIMAECRDIFAKKLHDYGASWRILRPTSLTDQLFIKAKRIRDLETTGKAMVDEGIRPEFLALVNYVSSGSSNSPTPLSSNPI